MAAAGVCREFPCSEYRIALPRRGPQHRRSARARHLPAAPGEWRLARPDRGAAKLVRPAWFVAGAPAATLGEPVYTSALWAERRRRTTRPELQAE